MDKDTLKEVQLLGSLQYTPEQVCKILGLSRHHVLTIQNDLDDALHTAYWKGFYETDVKLRLSVIDLATKGSSPAQTMLRKMIEDGETRRFYEH